MEVKPFQRDALETLAAYLDRARQGKPGRAFLRTVQEREPGAPPAVPQHRQAGRRSECLPRLPTGVGKTLLAAHSIAVAGRGYLERDHPVEL